MITPFARSLARKSRRALRSARLIHEDGDAEGAINRAYYAMLNIARAALLAGGVPEDNLPSTHRDVIAALRQYAVQSGNIDLEFAGALNRTDALRMQADYSATEFDARSVTEAVARAESFVTAVERVFSLKPPGLPAV